MAEMLDNSLNKFKRARLLKGLSIMELCRCIDISYDNYIKYEKDEVKEQYMCLNTLIKFSQVCDCDVLTDYHKFKLNAQANVRDFMQSHKYSIRKFAKLCEVSVTTVKHWRNGTCSPSYEIWDRIFKP